MMPQQQQQQHQQQDAKHQLFKGQDLQQATKIKTTTTTTMVAPAPSNDHSNIIDVSVEGQENISTLKKGVLWQQQNYDKFHQRLFSRWKKRYFILTTNYLVCFKRSTAKVGRSEMGKFLYKTSLMDITNIEWLKPTKSDKGAIILHINGQFNLFLWSKENLEDWMLMIKESIERNKIRRFCMRMQNGMKKLGIDNVKNGSYNSKNLNDMLAEDLYENTNVINLSEQVDKLNAFEQPKQLSNAENLRDAKKPLSNLNFTNDMKFQTITKCSKEQTCSGSTEGEAHLRSQQETNEVEEKQSSPSIHDNSVDNDMGARTSSSKSSNSGEHIKMSERNDDHSANDTEINRKYQQGTNNSSASTVDISKAKAKDNIDEDYDHKKSNSRSKTSKFDDNRASVQNARSSDQPDSPKASVSKSGQRSSQRSNHKSDRSNKSDRSHKSVKSNKANQFISDYQSDETDNSVKIDDDSTILPGSKKDEDEIDLVKNSCVRKDSIQNSKKSGTISRQQSNDSTVESTRNNIMENYRSNNVQENESDHQVAVQDVSELGNRLPKHQNSKVLSNLVRRDDSWQSLVSLTRVGKVGPASLQVAQRSLYAQHIMPERGNNDEPKYGQQQQIINLDSTVTPSRAPFFRHQSIQPTSSYRQLRQVPQLLAHQQHPTNFEKVPNSPSLHPFNPSKQTRNSSYQRKLLHLQLLHNSNNVDYVRHYGNGITNDYQIYGPESTITNHYGYSSMRSNLKSAASEFSFIRPSSARNQSTLPHHHHQQECYNPKENPITSSPMVINNEGSNNQYMRTSLVLNSRQDNTNSNLPIPLNMLAQLNDNNNNNISGCLSSPSAKQYLINPMTGECLSGHQQSAATGSSAQDAHYINTAGSDLTQHMRELPLKPNKRRAQQNNNNITDMVVGGNVSGNLPKSSSLTSSIASFFRRAFSRRSKRGTKKRSHTNKLAESCSSSLGAFEDSNFPKCVVPVVASAFSTGSKSVDDRENYLQQNQVTQPQRMVDMIQAFTSRAFSDTANDNSNQQIEQHHLPNGAPFNPNILAAINVTPKMTPPTRENAQQFKTHLNRFGSPLHKSNSISATMGLSSVDANNNRRAFLYDNAMPTNSITGAVEISPMMSRSAKVMSANLTPLISQRKSQADGQDGQFCMSPRNSMRADHLPRPSSIYGQPSMISSKVMTPDVIGRSNFGNHRNSLNNHHSKDGQCSQGFDSVQPRRQQIMGKMTFLLDTTRETIEELSSPIEANHQNLDYVYDRNDATRKPNFNSIASSPSSNRIHKLQAIVNPILPSTTMDTIYDNHPMLNGGVESSYSHYDNHNQLVAIQRNQQPRSPSMRLSKFSHPMNNYQAPTSPIVLQHDGHYARRIDLNQNIAPSRTSLISGSSCQQDRTTVAEMIFGNNKKPSAIVNPSNLSSSSLRDDVMNSINQYEDRNQPHSSSVIQSQSNRSPMLSRRLKDQASNYQQSPLVSHETRVMSKKDGVQATIIGGDRGGSDLRISRPQPVINIAGAPGINLEPSLAASLLRGTNIDAYESSTFDCDDSVSNNSTSQSSSKAFLVSTRLSKSIGHNQEDASLNSSKNSSPTHEGKIANGIGHGVGASSQEKSKGGTVSLGTSKQISLSSESGPHKAKILPTSRRQISTSRGSQEDSSSSDTTSTARNRNAKSSVKTNEGVSSKVNGRLERRLKERESSGDPSETDTTNTSQIDSLERHDKDMNWITSKLVE